MSTIEDIICEHCRRAESAVDYNGYGMGLASAAEKYGAFKALNKLVEAAGLKDYYATWCNKDNKHDYFDRKGESIWV